MPRWQELIARGSFHSVLSHVMREQLRKTWSLFTASEKRKALWMLLLVVLMAGSESASVLSVLPFLSALSRPAAIDENPWLALLYTHSGAADINEFIFFLGLGSMTIVVLSSAFKTVTLHALNRFVHLRRHFLSSRLLSLYLQQPYEFFLTRNPSRLAKNVLAEVDQLIFELIQPLAQLIAQGAIVATMAVLIFSYDLVIAACTLAILMVLYGAIYVLVRKRLALIGEERQAANAQRYEACNEALGGIKDVKITHSDEAYQAKFDHASRQYSRHTATNETLAQSPLYIVEAVGVSVLIAVALVQVVRWNDVTHVLPALGLYGFAAYRMLPAAQVMYRGIAKLRFSSSVLNSIHRDLTLPRVAADRATSQITPRHEIRLQGASYAYPSAPDKPIFNGLDLTIPANRTVGIVGRSGAGKSTLMDLLLGLLRPQTGGLIVDGVTIDSPKVAAWQRSIGYVPQQVFLSDASAAENIAFGVPRESIDMNAVQRAARAAQIHDFIVSELPDGYETPVGDRGIRLSGGQRQRIGIARALYRDPPVLFLDEATSALDPETEGAINAAIHQLSGQKTVVVIGHKPSSLKGCDRIVDIQRLQQS